MKRPGIFKKGHHSSKHNVPEGDTVPIEEFVQVQSALQEVREDCEDLSENVELARATARNLQEQLRTEQSIHTELRTSLGASEDRTAQLEADVLQGEEECMRWASACEAVESMHAEVTALRGELAQASEVERQQRVVGTAQKSQNDQLRAKLASLEKAAADAKTAAATEEGSALQSLTNEVEEARAYAKSEEAWVERLNGQVQAEGATAASLQERLRADHEESENSRDRVHLLETEMQEQANTTLELRGQLADLSARRLVSDEAVDKLQHEVQAGNTEVASLHRKCREASARGDGLSEAMSHLESELAEQADNKSTLCDVSDDTSDGRNNLEAALINTKRLEAELEERSHLIIELRSQLHEFSDKVESTTSFGSGADCRDDSRRAEVVESELNECHSIIQDLRAELHGATEEIRNSDVTVYHNLSSSSDIDKSFSLHSEYEDAVQEHKELLAAVDRAEKDGCAKEAELRAQLRSASDDIDKLCAAEKAAKEESHRLGCECDELRSSLQKVEDVIQAGSRPEAAEATSPAHSGEAVDCASHLQLKAELADKAGSCEKFQAQLADLRTVVEHYEGELASHCAELTSTKQGEDAASVKVDLLRSEVAELEASRANRERDQSDLTAQLDEERASHLAAAAAAQEAWSKRSEFNDRAAELKQLQEELAEEREAHLSAASAAQAAWDTCVELREELVVADELKAELERERASHLTAATAAEDAWGKNSALSTEVMSEEIALEQSEVRHGVLHEELEKQAEELQRLKIAVSTGGEESQQLQEAVHTAEALATGSEIRANELGAELQQAHARQDTDNASLFLELRTELEQQEEHRGACIEAAVAAAQLEASSHATELEKALHGALADKAELSDKLADTEYALQITSEAAAEDSDDSAAEHVGIREARRLKMECTALESQLREISSHKRNTADFGRADSTRQACSAATPQVWSTVQQLRAELAGQEKSPSVAANHTTPNFAVQGGITVIDHQSSDDTMGGIGSIAKPSSGSTLTFAPPTRSRTLSMADLEGAATSEACRDEGNPFADEEASQNEGKHMDTFNPFADEIESCHDEGRQTPEAIDANPFDNDMEDNRPKGFFGSAASPVEAGTDSAAQRSPKPSLSESPRAPLDSRGVEQRLSPSQRTKITPSFGSSDDSTLTFEIARLRGVLSTEEAACAEAREEVLEARRAREGKEVNKGEDDDNVAQLRRALAEETAKSHRLGEHALRAEESRRRLLHELAEDAEAEADLVALAKVLGRAAKAIATISREAPMQLPEEQPVAPATPQGCAPPATVPSGPRLGRLPSIPVKREADASDLM